MGCEPDRCGQYVLSAIVIIIHSKWQKDCKNVVVIVYAEYIRAIVLIITARWIICYLFA